MSAPTIHGKRTTYSASAALEAIGKALGEIKAQDGLTWSDIGAVLGKCEDQAAKYAEGTAAMDVVTFGRGKHYWAGRFTGYFDRLCDNTRPCGQSDRASITNILAAVTVLSAALEDDDAIDLREVRAHRRELEEARDAIEYHLAKLRPASVEA